MKLTTESIRVNDIELANEIIWVMNGTAIKQADEIEQLRAENARLTAAHAMQGEELVTLPRHMVYSMEDKLKAQAEEIRIIKTAIEDVKIYCNNPSAWDYYDETVSQKIRAILKAAGMA